MDSNAIFKGGSLPSWVKRFQSVKEATDYAKSVITAQHTETVFHVCCDPMHGDDYFYLIVRLDKPVQYQWLCSQGFYPMESA